MGISRLAGRPALRTTKANSYGTVGHDGIPMNQPDATAGTGAPVDMSRPSIARMHATTWAERTTSPPIEQRRSGDRGHAAGLFPPRGQPSVPIACGALLHRRGSTPVFMIWVGISGGALAMSLTDWHGCLMSCPRCNVLGPDRGQSRGRVRCRVLRRRRTAVCRRGAVRRLRRG